MRSLPFISLVLILCCWIAASPAADEKRSKQELSPAMKLFEGWKFSAPSVRRKTERFIKIADGMAGKKWQFNQVHSNDTRYHLSWCNTANRQHQCWMYRPQDVDSVHTIVLHTRGKKGTITNCGLEAFRQDSPRDWATSIYVGTFDDGRVAFWRDKLGESRNGGGVRFPIHDYYVVLAYEGVAHEFGFHIPKTESIKAWRGLTSARKVAAALASPKALRDALLANLDTLQAQVKKQIRQTNKEVRTLRRPGAKKMVLWKDGRQLRKAEFGESIPAATINTAKEYDKALQLIIARLDAKRQLIRREYRTLYQAASGTFPVVIWLGKQKAKK